MECSYHKKVHTKYDSLNTHLLCVDHGHCLNPIECPLFKNCPAHINGKNMCLAWSSKPTDFDIKSIQHIIKLTDDDSE